MTVNTATDRSTIAPTPKATAATCMDTPSWPPSAVPTPAARPSIRDLLITKSTFGPGTMISANESSANPSTWLAGIMRSAYGPACCQSIPIRLSARRTNRCNTWQIFREATAARHGWPTYHRLRLHKTRNSGAELTLIRELSLAPGKSGHFDDEGLGSVPGSAAGV